MSAAGVDRQSAGRGEHGGAAGGGAAAAGAGQRAGGGAAEGHGEAASQIVTYRDIVTCNVT